jgi:hypothetical protein
MKFNAYRVIKEFNGECHTKYGAIATILNCIKDQAGTTWAIGYITDNGQVSAAKWNLQGTHFLRPLDDLIMPKPKVIHERWVNVYKDFSVECGTLDKAKANSSKGILDRFHLQIFSDGSVTCTEVDNG